jgi:hypothetical protein
MRVSTAESRVYSVTNMPTYRGANIPNAQTPYGVDAVPALELRARATQGPGLMCRLLWVQEAMVLPREMKQDK